jgi:hypothetical protein
MHTIAGWLAAFRPATAHCRFCARCGLVIEELLVDRDLLLSASNCTGKTALRADRAARTQQGGAMAPRTHPVLNANNMGCSCGDSDLID